MTARHAALIAVMLTAVPAAAQTADEFFESETVTDLTIQINAEDWRQLHAHFMENTFYPCDLSWREAIVRNAGCRSRGYGSRSGVKPGLLVDFDHYVGGQTFLGLRSLVLDNLAQDPSMLRERLSMWLFARAGLPGPRQSYARLLFGAGREYLGLYAAVEDIDANFVARFGEPAAYVYEYRWTREYRFEDLGPELEAYQPLFEPRTRRTESLTALYGSVRDLVRGINDAAGPHAPDLLDRHIDLTGWLLHLAVENYLAEWDGLCGYAGLSNFYMYRQPDSMVFRLIPWDKDSTFAWLHMPPDHNFAENVLTRTIWQHSSLRAAYLRALVTTADAADPMATEAERLHDMIADAALADPLKPYSNEAFATAIEDVRRFARERGAIVRGFVRPLLSAADVGTAVPRSR